MTENLPAPLVPPSADLRDMPWMPLDIARLKRSKAWLACKKAPELAFYMINLWTASWHEMPPASLEDDDEVLCDAAMCDEKRWPKVRDRVLRGWVRINGRLFHPVVAEKATETWGKKEDYRRRTELARAVKEEKRRRIVADTVAPSTEAATDVVTETVADTVTKPATRTVTKPVKAPVTDTVTEVVTAHKREVRDRDRDRERERETPPPTPSVAAKAIAAAFLELREEHWPGDARLPAPSMTIEAEAEQFVAIGASPALAREVIDRVMRQNLTKGDGPPNSLKFCRLTLERAARQHAEAGSVAAPSGANGHSPASDPKADKALLWRGRLDGWLKDSFWQPLWQIRDCPDAVIDEFRLRLREKPPPGTKVARDTPDGEAAE